ncbi:DUF4333 domain-containing protein [Klenkia taihuensis]|uniref:DUF4333 domain-containing protein n=1 Tax=Klenkia taihuensis TaxID=1225127 RepID=A0A1I1PBY5_9ACTN|nr:DUF4333 domain-containing protein [Klenkia taihuensis]GHE11418.1 hypothetical protein GCM10011381_24660 [Klenkia taihuensis]SFD05148.1 protein of unknown function [Klenkia taihuensis]
MSRTRRTLLGLAAATLLPLGLASCGAGSIDSDDVEDQAETQLQQQLGTDVRPDIDCEDDLPAEEGATITCALTADGLEGTYDVTMTTTSVEGDTANFDIQVADSPR